jgi:hypothetical protein
MEGRNTLPKKTTANKKIDRLEGKKGITQCCGSGSGIWCFFEPWNRDGEKITIRIRDEHPGSYSLELRNNFSV